MKSIFQSKALHMGLGLAFVSLLSGCGNLSIGKQIQISLDPDTQDAKVEVEMGDGLEVWLDGTFPIGNTGGSIYFVSATKTTNAKIGLKANVLQLLNVQGIESITTLPSGSALPIAMTPPLIGVQVLNSKDFNVEAAFSLAPELQLGAVIGIAQMSNKYVPSGVAICQNFRNSQNLAFAAVCLYGPSTRSGGIFVGANFGDVWNQNASPSSDEVTNSNALRAMNLTAVSEPFRISAASLKAVKMSSTKHDDNIFDPSSRLKGNNGTKALSNVQKILRARQ